MLFSSAIATAHNYHVSITQMDYNTKNNTFEIAIKVFADDLESAIQEQGIDNFKLDIENQEDTLVKSYFKRKFQVKYNGETIPLNWVGKELENEIIWCYFELEGIDEVNKLELLNTTLLELNNDQVNKVNITVKEFQKSLVFKKGSPFQGIAI